MQREIESALAGITIIIETIAEWKSTTVRKQRIQLSPALFTQ